MIGIFFVAIGLFTMMLGLSLDRFENDKDGRDVRRMFILFGLFTFLVGLFFAVFTL